MSDNEPAVESELQHGKYETKAFELKLDDLTEEGEFEGYAAVFGNLDQTGDIIEPGAFKKTIRESKGQVPILWHHDPYEPIGVSSALEEDEKGLRAKGRLVMETQRGREAHALMKAKAVSGLSIGYQTVKYLIEKSPPSAPDWSMIRRLKELKLREFSPVTFPANALARVGSVKAEDLLSLERVLRELAGRSPDVVKALLDAIEPAAATRESGAATSDEEQPDVKATAREWGALIGASITKIGKG